MPAHQCPRCQLRFSYRTEVEAHLATDHRATDHRATDHQLESQERRAVKKPPRPVDLKTSTL